MTVFCSCNNLGSGFCCWFDWTQPSLNMHSCTCSRPLGILSLGVEVGYAQFSHFLQISFSILAPPVPTLPRWPCPHPYPRLQHSQQLYRHIYLCCKEETNTQKHYEALYGLLALISIELANEEVVVDLIRLVLAIQVGHGGRDWGEVLL